MKNFVRRAVLAAVLAAAPACSESPTQPDASVDPPVGVAGPGTIEIALLTSGPDRDANGYTLYVLSSSHPTPYHGAPDVRTEANDTIRFTGIESGTASLSLYDLAPNCTLNGANPRTVNVLSGLTAKVTFAVDCVASGSLRVTTVTTGTEPDWDGYNMFEKDRGIRSDIGHRYTSGLDLGLSSSGTVVASALAPGTYVVGVQGIAPNCSLLVPAGRTITIVAGLETPLYLEVTCGEPMQLAFVRGAGRSCATICSDSSTANTDIYVAKSNGTGTVRLTAHPGADLDPAWSPDGGRIVFASDRAGNREIYVMNADGSDPVRLTDEAAADYLPAYSPDGKRIAFVSRRDANAEIYVMNADGTNVSRLTNNAADDTDPAWSPDGTRIAFSRAQRSPLNNNYGDIVVMSSTGAGETQLTFTAVNAEPAWSPDGGTIAMRSKEKDTFPGVYLMSSNGSQVRRILGLGYHPASPDWSRDGKLIAFHDWDCWDVGPCPRGIIIGTVDGLYSGGIDDASQPAWRPR